MNTFDDKGPDFLSGGGFIGDRMRSIDWEKTELGAPSTWPEDLKKLVYILLKNSGSSGVSHSTGSHDLSTEEALRKSQQQYRALFESIDEGFAILELIYENNIAVDFRYIETNSAFEKHSGRFNVTGKTVSQVIKNYDPQWTQMLARIVETGTPVRVEQYFSTSNRWLNAYASRIGDKETARVAVVFTDITARKKAEDTLRKSEERKAYLLKLSDAIRTPSTVAEMEIAATRVLGEHLRADRCFYTEIKIEDGVEYFIIERDYHSAATQSHAGKYEVKQFVMIDALRKGMNIVSMNVKDDKRIPDNFKSAYLDLHIKAFIGVPIVRHHKLQAILGVHSSVVRQWTSEEIWLVQETAERTWTAMERVRAENALRESELRYRNLVEANAQATWETDATGAVVSDSPSWRALTGFTYEEWLGFGWLNAIYPKDRENAEALWKNAIATKENINTELRIKFAGGGYRWTNIRATPIYNDSGEVVKWSGMNIDIHNRMVAERQLQKSKDTLADELENTRRLQSISSRLFHHGDTQAMYNDILQTAIEIMQADFGSIQRVVADTKELHLMAWKGFHPEAAKFWEWVKSSSTTSCGVSLANAERIIIPDIDNCDFLNGTEDQDFMHLSGIRAVQSTPLITRSGRVVGIISTHWKNIHQPQQRKLNLLDVLARLVADIIERNETEEALRLSEERFRKLVQHAPVPIIVFSGPEHVIEIINEGTLEIWGKTKEEVLFKKVSETTNAMKVMVNMLDKVYNSGEPIHRLEFPLRFWRQGQEINIYFNFILEPFRDHDNVITGVIMVGNDVTTQVEARQEVEVANKEVQLVNERLEVAFKNIPSAVYQFDNKGNIIYLNQRAAEFLDYNSLNNITEEKTEEDFRQRLFEKYTVLDEKGEPLQAQNDSASLAFSTGKKAERILQFIYKDNGHSFWILSNSTPVYDEKGNLSFVLTVDTDITDQVLAHKEIEESELLFRTLTETLPQLIWVRNVNGNLDYGSKNWEEYTGIKDVHEAWTNMTHPDDLKQVEERWHKAAKSNKPFRYEVRLKSKQGNYRWFYAVAEPVLNTKDEVTAWVGALTDIHDQKVFTAKLEKQVADRTAQLQNSRSFLKQLVNSSVEFIYVLDKDLKFTMVNKKYQESVGLTEDELLGKHLFEISPAVENSPLHAAILCALKGETVHLDKRPSITQSNVYEDTYFIPLFRQKNVEGVIIMARNVTDIVHSEILLEEKNRELERSNKELESFNYITSHDLQEPLRKIQTFIDRVQNTQNNKQATEDFLRKIDESAKRMNALIQSVLGYSRLSASREKFTSVDLNKVMTDVINDFELLVTEKQANITSQKLPVIKANPLQMHQLFSNLISNSLKFSKENPVITITCKKVSGNTMPAEWDVDPDTEYVCLGFQDNGIGFDPVYKDRIFSLFQRLHGADEYTGTGIGLSIVKKVVDRHKGFIKVTSKPNDGTEFLVWLPL